MPEFKSIQISELQSNDADVLAAILQNSRKDYSKHFIPFEFNVSTIKSLLSKTINDKYFAIRVNTELAGFFMLRGFDAGYRIPSYGVWIDEKYSGIGLSTLTLQYSISFCKLNGIKKIMLKVAKENLAAKHIYEKFDFKQGGLDPKIGHLIYYKEL
jgi:RimJ/RimL family protein N-acetyltransferase